MKKVFSVLVLAGILISCNTSKTNSTSTNNQPKTKTMNNKEIVGTFLGAVAKQDAETMRKYANSDYIQHNPFVPTGLEPFIGLLPVLKEHGTYAENVRFFQDGNYVFMHNIWHNAKPFGADQMVAFDIIRVDENGKVAEHWDAMMPQTPPNASGRTLTDGEKTAADLDKTEANKTQVKALFDILINGTQEEAGAAVMANFDPNYKQHNPKAADGLEGFMNALPNEQWVFTKQHKVLGEGNFVLSISEGTHKGMHSVFYDLLRLENGKIVEHWDVIQEIPTEGLAHNNGMFGF
ncbi:nuclear transport factor 2 family protein [Polaribacter sp.]|uniref:nuclear transport factor 2 family protein n=1 Tax=Polaribacter sp. TaxID=1920175 RepID=UPI003F6AD1AC